LIFWPVPSTPVVVSVRVLPSAETTTRWPRGFLAVPGVDRLQRRRIDAFVGDHVGIRVVTGDHGGLAVERRSERPFQRSAGGGHLLHGEAIAAAGGFDDRSRL
jgi:hypothetical protein